jgi:sugar phosphate isomerase/epimerase
LALETVAMPRPISIQLYSLRDKATKEGLQKVLETVADIGYAGVELAGYGNMKPAEIKKACDNLGLKISGSHTAAFDVSKAQQVIDDAKTLGLTCVGSGFGPKDFESEDQIKANADKVNAAADKLSAAGLKVYYHNHWWEWDKPNKGELLYKLSPKLWAQFDIYWVATAGADPVKVIQQYADRTLLIHVKDGPCEQGKPMTAVGKGKVKTKAALKAADKSKAEWYIVELDACEEGKCMVQEVKDSYTFLISNKLATGTK